MPVGDIIGRYKLLDEQKGETRPPKRSIDNDLSVGVTKAWSHSEGQEAHAPARQVGFYHAAFIEALKIGGN